ncbi:hypothetical protein M0813_11062 [Anaeramoeba flamelloides]|uniref:Uncharacterized protein n=1 Tax=Anaeramoeba flamelloides TaxID=1746091 RepID=A0ABQ8ZFQ2_9EUKA|nr:hypothetical protein M0813_11062 [Anaeramoeba flamelloides]
MGGIIKTMNNRNRYNYELQFSLRAVHKYLPWVNKIYILINSNTDYPYWIKEENSGKIVVYDRLPTDRQPDPLPNSQHPLSQDYFFHQKAICLVFTKTITEWKSIKNNAEFRNLKRPDYKFAMFSHLPKPMRRDFILKFQEEYKEYAELVQSHYKK